MSTHWFTSDTHYHHKNIVRGISEWSEQETRNFKTLEEHDEAIIQGINNFVKEDDILWHLGDWSFGGIEQIWNFRKRIICKNINLILGNHDHHIEGMKVLPNVHVDVKTDQYVDGPCKIYNDERDLLFGVEAINLFSSVQHVYFDKIGNTGLRFFLSHYAHRVWPKSHHGCVHLYGHSHYSLDIHDQIWGKSMDVGVDAAYMWFGEYRPFSEYEIQKIMNKREVKFIDHHNKNTN